MELRTKRLLLRPFREDDVTAFASFVDDAAYRRHLGTAHPDVATFVRHNTEVDRAREPSWVIEFEGRIAGSIFLGVNTEDRIAELACMLAPHAWGKGIAREASRAAIAHAFSDLGVEKICARTEAGNAASRRAMERGGFTLEGVLRAHRVAATGERVDEALYALLRSEWRE